MSHRDFDLIQANFLDVCHALGVEYQDAIDGDFDTQGIHPDSLRDLAFGAGYVRGLADAYDMTSMQLIDEVLP